MICEREVILDCRCRRGNDVQTGTASGKGLQAGLAHELFHEGIAHLHRPALLLGGFIRQILRGKGRAREAVPTRGRADVKHRIANALGRAARDLVMAQHAEAEGIDEGIALVAFVEIHLAGNRGDAEAIAVMRNAADHSAEQAAHLGIGEFAKTERIQRADRPRAHREDVANDAAHARGRALEGFDGAGMVVRFDLEGNRQTIADVNDAGVFLAGADQDFGRLGGEGFEQRPGVFVAAMLAPHHGENAQLGVARLASAKNLFGVGVFFRREVVFGNQFRGDGGFGHGKIKMLRLNFLLSSSVQMKCNVAHEAL